MNYQNFVSTFFPAHLKPWEHDYYVATFTESLGDQGFADYCFSEIEGLDGLWFRVTGTTVYFVVKKGTTMPEQFGSGLTTVTEVPVEPEAVPE
jgi:hypothetical protein